MELTLEQYEQIQKFADGKMTDEEQELFLVELSNNKEMLECLDLELSLRKNQETSGGNESEGADLGKQNLLEDSVYMKSLIEKIGSKWDKKDIELKAAVNNSTSENLAYLPRKRDKQFFLWRSMAVAASIILAVSIIFWQFSKKNSVQIVDNRKDSLPNGKGNIVDEKKDSLIPLPQPQREIDYATLFKNAYKKDRIPVQIPDLLADAFMDYEDGDYKTLQAFNIDNPPRSRGEQGLDQTSILVVRELGHYYKGISFIETKNEDKAINNLRWVINHAKNKDLHTKAQWYLALLYLKKGNKEDATSLLIEVAANKNMKPYHIKSLKLLESLR